MSELGKIGSSIDHLQGKVKLFQEAMSLAQDLNAQGEVHVDNPNDSSQCIVRVKVPTVTDQLISISQLGSGKSDIIYKPEEDVYKCKVVLRER